MTKPHIIKETPASIASVKHELDRIKKRDKELTFRGGKVEEYLQQFSLSYKESQELYKKIEELSVPRLKEVHIIKIIDLLPKHLEELKVILQAYTITVKDEHLKKILELVVEHTK